MPCLEPVEMGTKSSPQAWSQFIHAYISIALLIAGCRNSNRTRLTWRVNGNEINKRLLFTLEIFIADHHNYLTIHGICSDYFYSNDSNEIFAHPISWRNPFIQVVWTILKMLHIHQVADLLFGWLYFITLIADVSSAAREAHSNLAIKR